MSFNTLENITLTYAKDLTRAASIACYDWIGRGDEKAADAAAVAAMRKAFDSMSISGRIVIGEGERDKAPMLYMDEELGLGGAQIDIAVDPLEGTTICAQGGNNSISVLALAPRDTLLHAPDLYMQKIAVGGGLPKDIININDSVTVNIKNVAAAKKLLVTELTVCILNRPRHKAIIEEAYKTGAKVKLISDGDVLGAISTAFPNTEVDLYLGIGGAPEGVLAAAALVCVGGQMQGKLIFNSDEDKQRAVDIKDYDRVYKAEEMIKDDVIFCATGVTNGWLLEGVQKQPGYIKTSTLVMHRAGKLMSSSNDLSFVNG